ncbi:hypothetical protein GOB93_03365 [Acetobacter musti]|uniref:Uncharacterized protein n=1 Tax=Acetobacter musti TaxID=864732 RepID=A0ABX0JPX2_9PROT|nr:hypothetical protein [Acetobacter musti]NHN83679.1 hypothetical protein [Acetobacter musti]
MSGLDLSQFKNLIVRPVVVALGLPGDIEARTELHTGIALVESGLSHLQQIGNGPALGVCQMESATHDDTWVNFLYYRPDLASSVRTFIPLRFAQNSVPASSSLIESLSYSVAMAAVRFYRTPVALPARGLAGAQCAAWKAGYNTQAGAGAVDYMHIAAFQKAIDA